MGDSDKPFWVRYTTLEMARDVVEVLDYIGWTSDLQLHVLGHSLGGMIAQELACLIPGRICTLNLISTAARIENTASFSENFQDRVSMLRPRNLEGDIINTIRRVFTDEWLAAPDDADLPTRQTPHCPRPRTLHPPSQEAPPVLANAPLYPHFETNYQRAMAEELLKKTSEARGLGPPTFSKKGFFNQVLAATWHRKTEAQLRALADAVGRERIMVIHGEADRLIACELGERLMRALEPAVALVLEGMGHAPFVEQARPFNELIEQRFAMGEKLNCG